MKCLDANHAMLGSICFCELVDSYHLHVNKLNNAFRVCFFRKKNSLAISVQLNLKFSRL